VENQQSNPAIAERMLTVAHATPAEE